MANMKLKKYMLVAAASLMVGAVVTVPTMAYFTDSHQTTGSVLVQLGDSELVPNDSAEGLIKTVSITNTSTYDAFVRVKAIYSKNFKATLTEEAKTNGWREAKGDEATDFYYYDPVLAAGDTTKELKIQIEVIDNTIADKFNVVIVEEATRVLYGEDGKTTTCDWNSKVMSREDYDAKFQKKAVEQSNQDTGDNQDNQNEEGND